ncbi:MAG: hypothetical protein NT062_29340 [Proteobacteria bacterium]|nr:hypothetical protein [Pseudomonadota bacterium]
MRAVVCWIVLAALVGCAGTQAPPPTRAVAALVPPRPAPAPPVPSIKPLSVRFVYLVSQDREVREDYRRGIERAATSIQAFYAGQLGGTTGSRRPIACSAPGTARTRSG